MIMKIGKLKELANVFIPKEEAEGEERIDSASAHHFFILVVIVMGMGLFYIYNDVDYDLQIKHYYKSREELIDRRYIYITDQKELNEAGMRSNVETKLRARGSNIAAPHAKQIVIKDEEAD